MRRNLGRALAVLGSALTALSLTGSTQVPANDPTKSTDPAVAEARASSVAGSRLFKEGRYLEARVAFRKTASLGLQSRWQRVAAPALNNAGGAALASQDFRDALTDFLQARRTARDLGQFDVLARTLNNLSSLYLQTGNPDAAMRMAQEGLAIPLGDKDPTIRPKLRFQLASALAHLHRFDDARPTYRAAIEEFDEQGDVDSIARVLTSLGSAALDAGYAEEANTALTEALRLARMHRLVAANILRGLARVKAQMGDTRSASALFDASIAAPAGIRSRWIIYADRGDFRLSLNDLPGALSDFRAASRLASLMRADIVPADQDRIALENGLSRVAAGLVEAGNRLARQSADKTLLKETFNAAEQDRLWSLRALIPAPNDWRTRLPRRYWDLLARFSPGLLRSWKAGQRLSAWNWSKSKERRVRIRPDPIPGPSPGLRSTVRKPHSIPTACF